MGSAGRPASKRGMMIAIVSTATVFQGSASELEKSTKRQWRKKGKVTVRTAGDGGPHYRIGRGA